jgi:hypothetical protein
MVKARTRRLLGFGSHYTLTQQAMVTKNPDVVAIGSARRQPRKKRLYPARAVGRLRVRQGQHRHSRNSRRSAAGAESRTHEAEWYWRGVSCKGHHAEKSSSLDHVGDQSRYGWAIVMIEWDWAACLHAHDPETGNLLRRE